MGTTKRIITEHKEFAKLHKKVFTNTDIPDLSYIQSKRLEIAKFYSENEIASHILIKRYKQLCYDKQNFNAYFLCIPSGVVGGAISLSLDYILKELGMIRMDETAHHVNTIYILLSGLIPLIAVWGYIYFRKSSIRGIIDFLTEYEEKIIAQKLKKDYDFDVDLTEDKADVGSNKVKAKADSNKVKAKVKLHKYNSSSLK